MMLSLVWDVDDVLNDLMRQWFRQCWSADHPESTLTFEHLSCNPPDAVLSITRAEYLASMDAFRESEQGKSIAPDAQVLSWFRQHGHCFRHIALTARPLAAVPGAAFWVFQHFGEWIRSFGVVPTRSEPGVPVYHRSKGEYLEWMRNGDILIDDADENIRSAVELGMKGLQPKQPWNRSKLTMAALLQQLTELAGIE